ncbi:MAG: putative outer membrane protein [Halothiobacillaceae bacterium]|nr:MAG: putative outer membrane protein [Halothiobacillaceae bacterium]
MVHVGVHTMFNVPVMTGWCRLLSLVWVLSLSNTSWGATVPLWEVGIGVAGLDVPFYRGAEQGRRYLLPLPYLIYRGDRLKIDRSTVRGTIFSSERVVLDLSLAGGVPVPQDGAGARAGMPGLDSTLEMGPSLELRVWKGGGYREIWLHLPLRSAFSVGSSGVGHVGWVWAPSVEYSWLNSWQNGTWKTTLAAGPLYADARYHDYFYTVEAAYITATRSEYQASSGYGGSRVSVGIERRWGDVWLGLFGRYDTLQGAAFEGSPLVETNHYHAIGFAMTWLFLKSKTAAPEGRSQLEAQVR